MTQVNIINLSKSYPNENYPVLENFSLALNDGEMVSLLGPSGSGKSTLLKLITGIERPDAGDVQFDGQSILKIPPNKREAVFMFQKAYLFPFLNVEENVGFGLKVKGKSAEAIRGEVALMLDLIGLPGIEKKLPGQLSGGEQQRVALARALVTRPKLFLLDEPLSSLDTEARMYLQQAIRKIQQKMGVTTILVTHDLGEAMAMSDRMALIHHGEIVALDHPEVLFHHPPNRAAAEFVGISTFLCGNLEDGILKLPNGNLKVSCQDTLPNQVTYAIRPEHIDILREPAENTLCGKIHDCVFRGEYIEYQVAMGQTIVRSRVPMPVQPVPEGESVFVRFPKEHMFSLSEIATIGTKE